MSGRYFEGNHPELEARLASHFARVRRAFEDQGWRGALVLGGGYGRGEGGVLQGPQGVGFSNDLDYFLFDEAPRDSRLQAWCHQLERTESAELGLDVEIKCLRADSLGEPSRSMMFADMVAGHVVVAGDGGFLARLAADLDCSRIAPAEATRLLWNRGSGLFFANCRMGREAELAFVIRNHAKLKLALGDAWLCLHGQYTPRCRERAARLAATELPEALAGLHRWHAEGVAFKFRPFAAGPSWPQLAAQSQQLMADWGALYLAVEQRRLQRPLADFASYLALPRLLHDTSLATNLALAVRDRLQRGGGGLRPPGDYPRAGLMRALPCLLGLTVGGIAQAGCFLPRPAGDGSQPLAWEPVYAKWWAYYS